jgi:16S rRNA (uracil1498-N3)-methyltransferase
VKPPRFFVTLPSDEQNGNSERSLYGSVLVLSSEDSHHIRSVLRLKVGATVEVADISSGLVFLCTITQLDSPVHVTVKSQEAATPPKLRPRITLFPALCKGEKNELIIDWATELGCTEIIFWQGDHSVVKLKSDKDVFQKEARFQKIGLAAAKQSRQPQPPHIRISTSLSSALEVASKSNPPDSTFRILCSLSPSAQKLSRPIEKIKEIHIVIGPEGDLSAREEDALCAQGYVPTTLGDRVLRSELAVVTALVSVHYTFSI